MNNGSGSYRTTPQRQMKAFDKLPKRLREYLANSNTDWATAPILTMFIRAGWTGAVDYCIKEIAKWERARFSSLSMARVWGPDHPQAIDATRAQIRKMKA